MSEIHADSHDDEVDLIEIFHILRRRKWLIALATMACCVGALIYGSMQSNVYHASLTVKPYMVQFIDNGKTTQKHIPTIKMMKDSINNGGFDDYFKQHDLTLSDISVKNSDTNSSFDIGIKTSEIAKLKSLVNELGKEIEKTVNEKLRNFEDEFNAHIIARDQELAEVDSMIREKNREIEIAMLNVASNKSLTSKISSQLGLLKQRNDYIRAQLSNVSGNNAILLKKEIFDNQCIMADLKFEASLSDNKRQEAFLRIQNLKEIRDYRMLINRSVIIDKYMDYENGVNILTSFNVEIPNDSEFVIVEPNIKILAIFSLLIGWVLAVLGTLVIESVINRLKRT